MLPLVTVHVAVCVFVWGKAEVDRPAPFLPCLGRFGEKNPKPCPQGVWGVSNEGENEGNGKGRNVCRLKGGWHGCEQGKVTPDIEYSEFFILPGTDVLIRRMPPRGKCARLVA